MRRSRRAPVSRSEPNTSVHSTKGSLGGHQDRSTLVTLAEHLEEQLGASLGQGHEAQFVDDQKLESCEPSLQVEQTPFVPGLDQLVNPRAAAVVKPTDSPL